MRWLCVMGMALGMGTLGLAQDRMPKIPEDKLTEAQRKASEERRAEQKSRAEACKDPRMDAAKCTPEFFEVHGPMVALLRSPGVMSASNPLINYVEFKTSLPPRIKELVILIAAREWSQQYVWNSHYKSAMNQGLNPETAKAVAEGRRPTGMTEDEEATYDFCAELHKNRGVSDATYGRALSRFKEEGIIDMVSVDAAYSYLSMVMNVARTPLPKNASAPPLPVLPN